MAYHIAPGLTQARQISRHIVDIFTPKTQAYIEKYIGISRDVRREGKVGIVSFVLGDPCTWDAGDAAVHRKSGPKYDRPRVACVYSWVCMSAARSCVFGSAGAAAPK